MTIRALTEAWWRHFRLLFDTDRNSDSTRKLPSLGRLSLANKISGQDSTSCARDADFHAEVRLLLRMIVLGAPARGARGFNGASTFFLWGAALLNANAKRSRMSLIDLVVHESSHVLLFGLAAEGALLRNSSNERYASPLRPDSAQSTAYSMDALSRRGCIWRCNGFLAVKRFAETMPRRQPSEAFAMGWRRSPLWRCWSVTQCPPI